MSRQADLLDLVSDEAPLCVGCGLCCDGTIFEHAVVTPGEEPRLLAHGMKLAVRKERTVFLQPCRYASCGHCLNYEDRFDICRSFRCELLKRYESGEIDPSEARATIHEALELVSKVRADEPAAARFRERRSARRDLAGRLPSASGEERPTLARRLLNIISLDTFLDTHFRRKKQTAEQ